MDISSEENKRKIIGLITALQPNVKIYLFGSRARGTQDKGSDIDIAIEADKKLELVDIGEIRDVINSTYIPHKVDIVDINRMSQDMRELVTKERISWKS